MRLSPHRRAAGGRLAALVAAGALMTGTACSADVPSDRPTGGTSAPQPSSPADICAGLVSYWAEEALKGSTWAGLDWEQKGLTNEQLAIHDGVLAAARTEERRNGRDAALKLIERRTKRECEAHKGATGSSENWRPPG